MAVRDRAGRNRARSLLVAVIASACASLEPRTAPAFSTQFVLDPSESLVSMGGDFAKYPSNSVLTLNLDLGHAIGNRAPLALSNFFLPAVPLAWGGKDVFNAPSTLVGTFETGTGGLSLNPVDVELWQTTRYTVTPSSSFSVRLTTGAISGPPCGQFPGGSLGSGAPFDLQTGAGTPEGVACVDSIDPETLFGLRLVGTASNLKVAVPEPDTLMLIGCGLIGIAFAGSRNFCMPLLRSRRHVYPVEKDPRASKPVAQRGRASAR